MNIHFHPFLTSVVEVDVCVVDGVDAGLGALRPKEQVWRRGHLSKHNMREYAWQP